MCPAAAAESGHGQAPGHPRWAPGVVGHARVLQEFRTCLAGGRVPHAWLLAGPRGVGKATFAYQAAIGIFANGMDPEGHREVPPDHPARRRVTAGSHGDLLVVERGTDDTGKARGIAVESVRALHEFFGLTSAEAGWRIAIIDALDELSLQGQNALLKVVEEPPPRTLLFLIAHTARTVPATILSRCRRLPFAGLSVQDCATVLERALPEQTPVERAGFARLANGAPGVAVSLADADALKLFGDITTFHESGSVGNVEQAHELSEQFVRMPGSERFPTFVAAYKTWIHRLAIRLAAGGSALGDDIVDNESSVQERYGQSLGLAGVLALWNDVGRIADAAMHAHLDRKQAVLDMLFAGRRPAGQA